MKNYLLFGMILLFVMNFTSCRSTKDMKYFQDVQNEVQQGKSALVPEYLIKADDNLYVDIKSMNVEVNQLFSPSKTASYGGGTQSDFGLVSSQYLNGYRVDQKGIIQLPVIGEVKVDGMTEEAANNVIQKRVNEYFKDATVKVKILTYKITVLGEVRNPGVYYNYDKSITILDALGLANGTTEYASIKKVLVLRTTASGKKSYRLDLREKNSMNSEAFYLIPNDILYIEPDNYKNSAFNTTVFSLTLAAISTTILILSYIQK
ncbi:MAG: polysaccharide biosynthesis/export family protein [Mariniphaga sp.]